MGPDGDQPPLRRRGARALCRQEGVETLEVALIGALFVIVVLIAMPVLFDGVGGALESVGNAIQNAGEQIPDGG